jgi:uncharacterized phage infection (PIP) family protein YhgE
MNEITEDKYRRLYESTKAAAAQLELQVAGLKALNKVLEAEKRQWQADKIRQQEIIREVINEANSRSNQYLEENRQLKEELRKLARA